MPIIINDDEIVDLSMSVQRDSYDRTTRDDLAEGRGHQFIQGPQRVTVSLRVIGAAVTRIHEGFGEIDIDVHGQRFYIEQWSVSAPVDGHMHADLQLRPRGALMQAWVEWMQNATRRSRRLPASTWENFYTPDAAYAAGRRDGERLRREMEAAAKPKPRRAIVADGDA